eukprot:scaffold278706_cov51-Prasinocladus_malaysianus.AAC.2
MDSDAGATRLSHTKGGRRCYDVRGEVIDVGLMLSWTSDWHSILSSLSNLTSHHLQGVSHYKADKYNLSTVPVESSTERTQHPANREQLSN